MSKRDCFGGKKSGICIDSNDSALILMQRIFMLMFMNNGLYQEVCTISPLALFWSRMDFQIDLICN